MKIPPKNTKLHSLYKKVIEYQNKTGRSIFEENNILTKEQKDILRKYFIDGKTQREIGQEYGISEAAISAKMISKRKSILSKLTYWTARS